MTMMVREIGEQNKGSPTELRVWVMKVAPHGKMIDKFNDPNGKALSFVTSALEFEDYPH